MLSPLSCHSVCHGEGKATRRDPPAHLLFPMNTETGESPAPQSPALDLSGFSGWHGAPSLGQGPPMAIHRNVAVRWAKRSSVVSSTTQPSPGPHAGSSGSAVCSPGRQPALCPEPSQLAAGECRPGKGWKGPKALREGLWGRGSLTGYKVSPPGSGFSRPGLCWKQLQVS